MKNIFIILLAIASISGNLSICSAESDHIGIIKSVHGDTSIVRNNNIIKAVASARILKGDLLETGIDGNLGAIFEDDTIVSMGPNSKIVIEEYLFQPAEKKMSFFARIIQGTISYLSGQIAKLSPEMVRLETPDATIGTRGTHVLIKVE